MRTLYQCRFCLEVVPDFQTAERHIWDKHAQVATAAHVSTPFTIAEEKEIVRLAREFRAAYAEAQNPAIFKMQLFDKANALKKELWALIEGKQK